MKKGDLVKYRDEKNPYIINQISIHKNLLGLKYNSLYLIESNRGKLKAAREDELQRIASVS